MLGQLVTRVFAITSGDPTGLADAVNRRITAIEASGGDVISVHVCPPSLPGGVYAAFLVCRIPEEVAQ
jgi:hypothetical protein